MPRIRPRHVVLAALSAGFLVTALLLAPPDAVQGDAQRLMYVHVPAAWVAFGAFLVVLLASLVYLRSRDLRWDRWAQASAELGVGLTALAIALGSIWGRVTWGVWWTWDARLVTTCVLLLVYIGYLGIRGLSDDPDLNARRAAVVGVLAFVNVPIVHFSVVWWRTLHQEPTIMAPQREAPPLAGPMALTLVLGLLLFTLLAASVVRRRVAALAQDGPAAPEGAGEQVPDPIVVAPSRTGGGERL